MNAPVKSDYDVPLAGEAIGGYQHPEPPRQPVQEAPPIPRQQVPGFGGQVIDAQKRGHQMSRAYQERKKREKLFKSLLAMEKKGVRLFTQDAVKTFGKGIVDYFPPQELFYDKDGRFKTFEWYKRATVGVQKFMQEKAAQMEKAEKTARTKSQFEAARGAKTRGEAYEGAIPAGGYADIEGPVGDYIGQKPSEGEAFKESGRQKRAAIGAASSPQKAFETDAGRVDSQYRNAVEDARLINEEITDLNREIDQLKASVESEESQAFMTPEEVEKQKDMLWRKRKERWQKKKQAAEIEEELRKAEMIRDLYRKHGGKISYPEAARRVEEKMKSGDKADNPLDLPRK